MLPPSSSLDLETPPKQSKAKRSTPFSSRGYEGVRGVGSNLKILEKCTRRIWLPDFRIGFAHFHFCVFTSRSIYSLMNRITSVTFIFDFFTFLAIRLQGILPAP